MRVPGVRIFSLRRPGAAPGRGLYSKGGTTLAGTAPGALADHLQAELAGTQDEETTILAAFSGLEKLESSLDMLLGHEGARARVATRLKAMLAALSAAGDSADGTLADKIQAASDDDIFDFIDNQLGV